MICGLFAASDTNVSFNLNAKLIQLTFTIVHYFHQGLMSRASALPLLSLYHPEVLVLQLNFFMGSLATILIFYYRSHYSRVYGSFKLIIIINNLEDKLFKWNSGWTHLIIFPG